MLVLGLISGFIIGFVAGIWGVVFTLHTKGRIELERHVIVLEEK